jgi:hypothetical protein
MFDYKDYVCVCLMFLLLSISLSFSHERVLRFRRRSRKSSLSLSLSLARKRPPRDTHTRAFPCLLPARVFALLHTNEHTLAHTHIYYHLLALLLIHLFPLLGRLRLHLQRVQPFLVEFLLQQRVHFPLSFHLIQPFKLFRNNLQNKMRLRRRVSGRVPAVPGVLPRFVDDFQNRRFERLGYLLAHRGRDWASNFHLRAGSFRAPFAVWRDVCYYYRCLCGLLLVFCGVISRDEKRDGRRRSGEHFFFFRVEKKRKVKKNQSAGYVFDRC